MKTLLAILQNVTLRPAVAALGLGAASALALPPVHAVPVLLVTLPAFLGLLGAAKNARAALVLGLGFGWGHHILGTYWVTHALFTDLARWWWLVPVAAPGLAVPLAVFSVLPALAAWGAPAGWRRVLAFSGAWVLAEMLRGVIFTGFPWNLLGTVWAFSALPLQPAAWVGVHGLSLLTVLIACLPALRSWRWGALGVVLLAGWMGFGAWRLADAEPALEETRLILVQGNVAQDLKWQEDQRLPIFQRYLALTEEAGRAAHEAHPHARIVVIWPETASPFLLAQDEQARRAIAAALPPNAVLLAGTVRADWGADGRLARVYNSLVGVGPDGGLLTVFDKAHLVPFGEYMPLGGLLPIRMVTGGMDFTPGPGPVSISLPGIPAFSPLICYEVIFPGQVVGAERPAWLLNVTNDAWFGHSAGPYQHLASARLRAVEEGLPMVRVAQTGISAVFDARGRALGRLGLGGTGSLTAWLPPVAVPTIFSWLGLLIPGFFAMIALLASKFWRGHYKSMQEQN